MIAFASLMTSPDPYVRYARPGIELAAEPDSEVLALASVGTLGRGCNLLLDTIAPLEDLEGLVVIHPHTQIDDPALCAKVREALSDPDVAVAGAVGSRGAHSLAWWEGEITSGEVTHRFNEHRGGELPAYSWKPSGRAPAEADVVDGFLMALSPWAVRNVRFDEALTLGHGFDVDFCHQVRKAGKKVVVADIRVIHHRSLKLFEDQPKWVEGHIQLAEKWDPPPADGDQGWKARARRAEAARDAQRALTYSQELGADALVVARRRELQATMGSLSWRLTAPLRAMNAARRRRRERRSQTAA